MDFVSWIKTILKNQESCIINGGKTTKYFKLERGARQGDPISAYLFILVLEIFFIFVKNNPKVKGLNIFKHEFLYTAYTDGITFFLKDRSFIIELMNELNIFSNFSGLKLHKTKCEIAGIGALNGVQVALCGMKCVNLNNETVKILGVHFSYNKNLEQDKNFSEHILKIESILKLWRMRQLTLEGRITVFKSLAISKVVHLLLITKLHNNTIDLMYKIQKNFIWQGKKAKIKHSTLCNGYENGGLKNVDLRNKITSIQCSWVKRLFEDDFHDWKVIPLFLIGKHLGKNFKFHNNIDLSKDILSKFPSFYQDIFIKWIKHYTTKPTLRSMILSEFIWFNSNIKVDSKPVHFSFFADKNQNCIG